MKNIMTKRVNVTVTCSSRRVLDGRRGRRGFGPQAPVLPITTPGAKDWIQD